MHKKYWYFCVQVYLNGAHITTFPFVFKFESTEEIKDDHFPLEEVENAVKKNMLDRDIIKEEHVSGITLSCCSPITVREKTYENYDPKYKN